MKYVNFKSADGEIFSFEVSDNFNTASNAFDRMNENFLSDNEDGEFLSVTDEPLGHDMSEGI
jgi:hypothetical protein